MKLDKNIVCPKCQIYFDDFICKNCKYKIELDNGVLIFPSKLIDTFKGYAIKSGLEVYNTEEPSPATNHFTKYIPGDGDIVLDVGGGDGNALANFAIENKYSKVYVIDTDFGNLQRAPMRQIDNLFSLNCSATKLPFKDESVDVVFTLFMVEHMYDYQFSDFLFEAKRVLKKGGKLIVATDSSFYDKYIHPIQRLFIRNEKFRTSGFLEKYDVARIAIEHHNLKSPSECAKFILKHKFFIQEIKLHLIAGKRLWGQMLYESIVPKYIMQRFLSTMFVVISRKVN